MRRLGYARTQPGITMVSNNSERSGEYLLEMSNINKSFPGVKALDNVNLKVRPHSIHALMGRTARANQHY
jgi:ABC-type uncharacterized transport system ATPase subunit